MSADAESADAEDAECNYCSGECGPVVNRFRNELLVLQCRQSEVEKRPKFDIRTAYAECLPKGSTGPAGVCRRLTGRLLA